MADPEPTRAALAAKPDAALRAQLDAGSVALVDLVGGDRDPPALDHLRHRRAAAATLEWQRWDDRGAEGTGRLEGVVCDPDCARGRADLRAGDDPPLRSPSPARPGASSTAATIEVASDDPDADSNSWLAAPC